MTDALIKEPLITNSFGEKFLFSVNREDFSAQSSAEIYQRELGRSLFEEGFYYFIVGTDSGLLPAYITSCGVPKGSHYIFIELPDVLERVRERDDELDNNIHFSSVDTLESTLDGLVEDGLIFNLADQSYELVSSLAARNDYVSEYSMIETESSEKLNAFIWDNVIHPSEELHLMNGIRNCQDSFLYGDCLKDVLNGITAVVLAAGPSLENYLPWVRDHRSDLMVIAVSRICSYLNDQSITPDVVVHADPVDLSVDVAKGIFNFTDSLLAYPSAAHPALVGQWTGLKVLLDPSSILEQVYPDAKPIHGYGVTVSNMAIDLAAYMGACKIVLLGVDLCHSVDGISHSIEAANNTYPAITVNMIKVSTNSGGSAYTIPDFFEAAKDLSRQAGKMRLHSVAIVNPSPNAMSIDGVEYCSLDCMELNSVAIDVSDTIRRACSSGNQLEFLNHLKEVVEKTIDELSRIEERVIFSVSSIKRAEACGKLPSKKIREEIHDLFNILINSQSSQLANSISRKEIYVAFKSIQGGFENDEDRISAQIIYLDAYLMASEHLRFLLNDSLDRIRCRKMELDGFNEIEAILDQWDKDNHPGRSMILDEQRKLSSVMNSEIIARIEGMRQQFSTFLKTKDEAYFSDVPQYEGLDNVILRVTVLYKAGDYEGFDYLLKILDQYPEELALPYIGYTRGMKAELEKDMVRAVENYQLALQDPESPLMESSLKRISAICLELCDFESAVYALESLAQISDQYAPSFAEILDAIGQPEDAIAVYEQYTERHVTDVESLRKLGLLYKKQGRSSEVLRLGKLIEKVAPGSGVNH
ncbi:MAG: 6-hydroxymethylpterin diphosphokinase MptE-like protein [Candidatus Sedimenticola sp. 6PFRAG1]